MYDHGGTSVRDVIKRLPTPTVDDSGKVSIGKIRKDDLVFWMNPISRKFSEKSWQAFSSRNQTEEGVGLEEDAALEQRGFRDGIDLCLGVMRRLTKRKRERERQAEENQTQSISIW